MSGRGRFIVFEGLDGAGTTTQTALLATQLTTDGIDVETTREPTTGPIGAVLRQALEGRTEIDRTTMALAFAADRADHLFNARNGVVRSLDQGRWVICDRYVLSSFAYQASEDLPLDWLAEANRYAIAPDLTVFVDTPPAVCLARIAARSAHRDIFENEAALLRTAANYRAALALAEEAGRVAVVDGDRPPNDVFANVLAAVRRMEAAG